MRHASARWLTAAITLSALLVGCATDEADDLEAGFEDLADDTGDDEPLDVDPDDDAATEAGPAEDGLGVAIRDNAFVPEVLEVEVGDTVTWTHEGSNTHTVTGRAFDSMELSSGEVFAVTFEEAGTVPYECTIHQGMAGEIVVG
jgi:plastocyanin